MKKTVAGAAVLLAMASSAGAGTLDFLNKWNSSDLYMGLLLSNSDISGESDIGADLNVYNATLGYSLPKGFAVEARFGAGSDQPQSLLQDPLSNYFAGMLRYHHTWNTNFMAYAAAGAAVRRHSDLLDVDETLTGAAFAVGLNLFGSRNTAVNVEYFFMAGEQSTESIGIGFQHYFR